MRVAMRKRGPHRKYHVATSTRSPPPAQSFTNYYRHCHLTCRHEDEGEGGGDDVAHGAAHRHYPHEGRGEPCHDGGVGAWQRAYKIQTHFKGSLFPYLVIWSHSYSVGGIL